MFPLLFEIPVFGGIRIYTYGALVAAAYIAGIWWTVREARRSQVRPDLILDLSFYIILATLAGSRILYIIADWERYLRHPLDILRIWEGGLVFYGGLIAAIPTTIVFIRKKRIPFLRMADLFMPGVSLGHAIGRLGCLAAGCCHGRIAEGSIFSITFPAHRYSLAPSGIPLFPSQLAESLASFLIFLALVLVRRRKRFEGQVFLVYLILYSVVRSALETFRGEGGRTFLVPGLFSTSQFISVCLVVAAAFLYTQLRRKKIGGSQP